MAKDDSTVAIKRNSNTAVSDPNKVFNPATRSYVDKDLYEAALKKEKINSNPAEKNQKKRT